MESSNRAEMVLDPVRDGNCPVCRKRGITTKLTQTSLGDVCEQGECGYIDGWDFGPTPEKGASREHRRYCAGDENAVQ